ncbi:ATP-dependent DNA helicase [Mangrovibacterium lignilyticum]|uniref:ATP-dependent DNA helicase n=1 Tax=Mangrovibacterium lignilyticum TaxID=2668052 RepID=UPI0013D4C1E7|nr:AAA family ATPase [Mangrovibacterium lignilyticum]
MLKKHIENQLVRNLGFEPTEGQKYLAEKLADFMTTESHELIFLLKGYAGTGKTSMVSALVKTLDAYKIPTVLLAPTGRAAKVLSTYTGKSAYTIHKRIYRQKSSSDGMGSFALDKNLLKNCFFLVDEASMISNSSLDGSVFGTGRLLDDLYEFVYSGHNCKLMLVGDTAQLPPVGMEISPALDASELQMYGVDVEEVELRDVVRQEMNSGILYNATALRELIAEDDYFQDYFPIELDGFGDVHRIGGGDLIEKISECYDRYGEQQTMVITRSNKRANKFNQGIRSSILYKETEITVGDLLMVVKNNYFWLSDDERLDFIANGDIVEVMAIRGYEELYGYRFADVSLNFIDYDDLEIDCKIFLDTLAIETASFGSEDNQKLFHAVAEDYTDIRSKKKRWEKIKANPHFNALQVKFAYAVTCHKAQGGQWDAVFIDQGYLVEDMLNKEFLRWLYTAFTRPVKELYLVNFNKEFFGE